MKSGLVLANRFLCKELIHKSLLSEVWFAADKSLDRPAIVKFLYDPLAGNEPFITAQVDHPNVVKVYEQGIYQDHVWLAMQFIHGTDLARLKPDAHRLAEIMLDVANAVAFAHEQGVIHLDLKPENILIDDRGHVYVLDFGLSHRPELDTHLPGAIIGTPGFRSPEQARGEPPCVGDDVFALGATLKAMLPAHPLFDEIQAPLKLIQIAAKATSLNPHLRHQSASDVAESLQAYLNGYKSKRLILAGVAVASLVGMAGIWGIGEAKMDRIGWAEHWRGVGENRLEDKDFERAVDAFSKSLDIHPEAKTYLFRCCAYMNLKDYDLALQDCESALKLDPGNEAAKGNRMLVLSARSGKAPAHGQDASPQ